MKKKIFAIAAVFFGVVLCSCASMYIRPAIQATLFRQQVPGNAVILFKAAQYILPAMGYKIAGSDSKAGTITLDPVDMELEPNDCDCGSMGLPIIKSTGTKAKVYFIVGVSSNELIVSTEIKIVDTSLMGALITGLNIVCVSKGGLEKNLAKNFVNKMGANALKLLFK